MHGNVGGCVVNAWGLQALASVQLDLEGKREELHQEVIRSTKYKNVHLKIQDAISEVSDCMTPAGSSRCLLSLPSPPLPSLPALHKVTLS